MLILFTEVPDRVLGVLYSISYFRKNQLHARIQRRAEVPDIDPGKLQSYRVPKQYWPGSPGKSQRCQAGIQCWAIIGPPAKRHLNGVLLPGR